MWGGDACVALAGGERHSRAWRADPSYSRDDPLRSSWQTHRGIKRLPIIKPGIPNSDCSDGTGRPGDDLLSRGLFVDIPAWGYHVFDVQTLG